MITIEHDIPLPTNASAPRYPWASMKPGDSFTVQGALARNAARSSFTKYYWKNKNRQTPRLKIVTRHEGGGVYRIWIVDLQTMREAAKA